MPPNTTSSPLVKSDGFEHCGEAGEPNILFGTLLLLLGVVTVIGNICTAMSFILSKKIRQLTLNTYIFSLAISDLGMGIFVFLFYSIWEFKGKPVLTSVKVYLWNSLFRLCLYLSVLSVILMTHDRYVMVAYPIKYRQRGRVKYAWIKLTIVWVVGLIFSLFFETYALKIVDKVPYTCRRNWLQPDDLAIIAKVLMLFIDFFIPFIIMGILNAMVFLKIWKGSRVQLERNMTNLGFTKRSLNHQFWSQWKEICTSHCSSMWKAIGKENECDTGHNDGKTAKPKTKYEESLTSNTVVSIDSCQTNETGCYATLAGSNQSLNNITDFHVKSILNDVTPSSPDDEIVKNEVSLSPETIILSNTSFILEKDGEQSQSEIVTSLNEQLVKAKETGEIVVTGSERRKIGIDYDPIGTTDYSTNQTKPPVEVIDLENGGSFCVVSNAERSPSGKGRTDRVKTEGNTLEAISSSKIQAMTLLQKRLSQEHKRLRKAAASLFIFVIVYFICWAPFYVTSTVACFRPSSESLQKARTITSVMLWCNSLVNPFLYAAMSQAYRDFLSDILCKYYTRRKSG